MNNEWILLLGLCCVVPVIVLLAGSVWIIRNAPRWIQPDTEQLQRSFEKLKSQNASANDDQLVNLIIHRQALRSGIVGALTSVGGLPVLPFGLTIDLYTTARIQSETLYFIAQIYSRAAGGQPQVLALDDFLAVRMGVNSTQLLAQGSQQVTRFLIQQVMIIIVEKTVAKLIPGIGLIVGFIINYGMMQGMGRLAARWYAGRIGVNVADIVKTGDAALNTVKDSGQQLKSTLMEGVQGVIQSGDLKTQLEDVRDKSLGIFKAGANKLAGDLDKRPKADNQNDTPASDETVPPGNRD